MSRKGTRKGRTVALPREWFESLEAYKRGDTPGRGKSLEQLGRELGAVLGEPVPISTVHDYLRRQRGVTEELTRAFAKIAELPLPPMGAESSDPEIAEWADLGRQLKDEIPDRFRQHLAAVRELVEALKRTRLR
jgi:hypothetical protein